MNKVELLYFKECPGYRLAFDLLQKVLLTCNSSESIETIEITTPESAVRHRFLGSPSIRINGKDIEGGEEESEYGLKCRIYSDTGTGVPSETMIRNALQGEE